jgi:ATP-binding cassette, subfamily G (WHITE), member 2
VCRTLRNLADDNRIVMIAIHQPASKIFHLFTHVMLLTQGGSLAYYGPVDAVVDYFDQ